MANSQLAQPPYFPCYGKVAYILSKLKKVQWRKRFSPAVFSNNIQKTAMEEISSVTFLIFSSAIRCMSP
jgi:hypothetical protein